MEQLTDRELKVTQSIIKIGITKAAESFSFFTKSKLVIDSFVFSIESFSDMSQLSDKENGNHILTTHIRGDMEGSCFIIFDDYEVKELWQLTLPASILDDKEKCEEMGKAILMEIDNIIAASVITQFANLLNLNIYGDVPIYGHILPNEVDSVIINSCNLNTCIMHVQTRFVSENVEFNPEFLWLLDQNFIDEVKAVAADSSKIELVNELLQA